MTPEALTETVRARFWTCHRTHAEGSANRVPVEDCPDCAVVAAADKALAELASEASRADETIRHFKECADTPMMRDVMAKRDSLAARLRAAETALQFYADPDSYVERATGTPDSFGIYTNTECPIWDDLGEVARAYLEGQHG